MAQTLQVLKCFSCNVFQVQIKKKTKRWECKLCGEKQSVIKVYGEGSGKDCRLHVQKLNEMRGLQEEAKKDAVINLEEDSEEHSWDEDYEEDDHSAEAVPMMAKKSKWSDFLEDDSEDEFPGMAENRKGMHENFPGSQVQGNNLEKLNRSRDDTRVEQPIFTVGQANRQQKFHLESEYKHPTFQRIKTTLSQDDPTQDGHRKEEMLASSQDFNEGKPLNPSNLKYKGLFCATKNEELDDLLEL